ncbi:MAG: lytic transglycosylase domain-containing protein [Chitinophagaceae bacterium]
MLKKLGISFVIAIVFIGQANANTGIIQLPFTDTSDIQTKEAAKQEAVAAVDPKKGFKDLFVTASTLSNGISAEQLNPLAVNFVEDYIGKFGKSMGAMKGWGKPYFDMMDDILTKHGLPKELKYLAVIESELKFNARSWAGAVGPWQFMPSTARILGLRVNNKVDERRDIFKSTHAASRYLTNLFSIYGDWLLVIAAYNGGPGKVNSAIRKSGSRDFWTLQKYLPAESRKHVKKFIATHYIMEGEGGITTLTKKEAGNFLLRSPDNVTKDKFSDAISQTINGRYNSSVIVKYIVMDIAVFHKINPNFDREIASNGKYELRLPADKMDVFLTKKFEILNESIQLLLNPEIVSAGTR